MRFVFAEVFFGDGNGYGINAETGIQIGGVGFDVVDVQSQLSDGCKEILKIALVFQLKVDFKVVGAVLLPIRAVSKDKIAFNQCHQCIGKPSSQRKSRFTGYLFTSITGMTFGKQSDYLLAILRIAEYGIE